MDIIAEMRGYSELVNKCLDAYITELDTPEKTIYKAMRYSLMAGGKRIRPVLSLATCRMLDGNPDDVIPFACALEMIHTYSLIHDDLPAMDNDDYRRGKPTNHKVFGEAIAILAGDALLNTAFEIMISKAIETSGNGGALRAINEIVRGSGTSGMIGGQVVDIESEGKNIGAEILDYMHRHKTGALIRASVLAPAHICEATKEQLEKLTVYSENIGLAFQIKDDILNVEGEPVKLGKGTGSDHNLRKATYVSIHGLEKSEKVLKKSIDDAVASLEIFGEKGAFLKELAIFIAERDI